MQWNAEDEPESPAPSMTPVIPWQTPWSSNAQTPSHEPTPRMDSSSSSQRQQQPSSSASTRQESLQRERERERGQRQRQRQEHHHHHQRQITLELLEARSINRALDSEIAALKAELQDAKSSLELCRGEEERLSAALDEKTALLNGEKNRRRDAETELRRCKSALAAAAAAVGGGLSGAGGAGGNTGGGVEAPAAAGEEDGCRGNGRRHIRRSSSSRSRSRSSSSNSRSSVNNSSSNGSGGNHDGSRCSSSSRGGGNLEGPSSSSRDEPPPSAPPGCIGDGSDGGPGIPDLLERTELSLTGTVRVWVDGMQAACSPGLRQALVLPWLLHKLFYLCTELISERHEELLNVFVGGVKGAGAEEYAYMDRHLRRHYLTVFPLSDDRLKAAIHDIMMALAHSMIDSEEWNPSVKDPNAVQAALTASGLENIVEEYLNIAVLCCLQHLEFTDDLGEVDSFSPEKHASLSAAGGEPAGESCIIIFPAFVVPGGSRDGGPGGQEQEEKVIGKRYVLNHDAR
ncbi:unnamed protein product [Scytosiphon promiscuus]